MAQRKLTSIEQELKKGVSIEEAHRALIEGFRQVLGTPLKLEEDLTGLEKKFAKKLREEKFSTHRWNFEGCANRPTGIETA